MSPSNAREHGARGVASVLTLLAAPAAVVALLAVGLDVAQWLRAAPLWVDEEMIALNIRDRPFVDLAGPLWLGQSAPLGWLVIQRAILLAFGGGELALRFVALFFGVLTVAAAVWVGRRWMHPVAAALLVAFCAIGQWMSHYRFELKHYSADACWALLLPALAAWALEEPDADRARRRWIRWWAVAALAQWVANGALLAAPACAVVLGAVVLRRHGSRHAVLFAATGSLWLLSVAANYALSLQYSDASRHLREYWAPFVAPDSAGVIDTLAWLAARLEPLATHPGGTTLAAGLWIAAVAGFFASRRPLVGVMFASVPVTAFALAAARLVPLHDRIALWIVPALYVGVALFADRGLHQAGQAWRERRWLPALPAAFAIATSAYVSADILAVGSRNLDLQAPPDSNHALDDRGAVRWLIERRQPGDALISTRLGWPAIWWYGGIDLGRPAPGPRLPDGAVMHELTLDKRTPGCDAARRAALAGHARALVYVGFPDMPDGFFESVLRDLSSVGTAMEVATFSEIGRVALIDLTPADGIDTAAEPAIPSDCIGLRPARRW